MATQQDNHGDKKASPSTGGKTDDKSSQRKQEITEQQQDQALEKHRSQPTPGEEEARREQGGHDRPVGGDHRPHDRPKPDADSKN